MVVALFMAWTKKDFFPYEDGYLRLPFLAYEYRSDSLHETRLL